MARITAQVSAGKNGRSIQAPSKTSPTISAIQASFCALVEAAAGSSGIMVKPWQH
jgi:hypothetical protein